MTETPTTPDGVPATLTAALVELQRDLPTVRKTRTATVRSDKGSYTYSYADLGDVTAALLPRLTALGVAFVCAPDVVDGRPVLRGTLRHVSGEETTGTLPLEGGRTPQAMGSSITYARRYLLGALTGLVAEEDDDGNTAAMGQHADREADQRAAEARQREQALAGWVAALDKIVRTTQPGDARKERLTMLWGSIPSAALEVAVRVPDGWPDAGARATLREVFGLAADAGLAGERDA